MNITYFTKVIQLKSNFIVSDYQRFILGIRGFFFLVGQVNIGHITIGDIFNISLIKHNFIIQNQFSVPFFWNSLLFRALCIKTVSFCLFSRYFIVWPPLVIFYLPVLTIFHGNLVWKTFYEIWDFSELPQGKKHNPLMMIRK